MKKQINWLAVGATIPSILIVLWMLLDNACTLSKSLGAGESINQCYTRWISAWSGWFAGAAAVATLVLIWRTVLESKKSNLLLARQTRAITGELEPVFNHNGNPIDKPSQELFRFWNYNRRAITIDAIEIVEPTNVTFASAAIKVQAEGAQYERRRFSYKDGGRIVERTNAVEGTPVGGSCKPVSYRLAFYLDEPDSANSTVDLNLRVHWRFRDENHVEKRSIDCCTNVDVFPIGSSLPV